MKRNNCSSESKSGIIENPSELKKFKGENTPQEERKEDMLPKPLGFKIIGSYGKARASILSLPHGEVKTPVYMPVGTKGTMKALSASDMESMGCKLMLGNTYHLGLIPGESKMKVFGGLHKFSAWKNNLLTDSGGFQMVSLNDLMEINEQGVVFKSHIDGEIMNLRPEDSIRIQNAIGADIMMQLDDVVNPLSAPERIKEACERSIRWLDRCLEANKNPATQNLFPIIQGGLDLELRKYCVQEMNKRDANGYAIGGLAGGEDKDSFWRTVNICTDLLPPTKPRYLMGVGYPVDLVVCSLLGVDMFDCVYPTRTARFGTVFSRKGLIQLKKGRYKGDFGPICMNCECKVCALYSRSYLANLFTQNSVCLHYLSYHNIL